MLLALLAFFRPAGLDFADMGAGIFSGIADQYAAHTLPGFRTPVAASGQAADAAWLQAMNAIQSATDRNTGMVDPVLLDSYSKMLGIDLSGIVQAGQTMGAQYGGLADTAGQFGGTMAGEAAGAFGRGNDIWNTARDPQNQLHDFLLQQTVDASRGGDSARGLAMSPYSAGLEQDATRKFEMDWQNQQLNRQIAGGGAANAAGTLGANDLSGAMGYYGMQPGYTGQSAMAPVAAQQYAYGAPIDYSNMFTGAMNTSVIGPQANLQNQINPYLGLAAQQTDIQSQYDMNKALAAAGLTNQAIGEFNTGYRGQSGVGNPMNWMGMG